MVELKLPKLTGQELLDLGERAAMLKFAEEEIEDFVVRLGGHIKYLPLLSQDWRFDKTLVYSGNMFEMYVPNCRGPLNTRFELCRFLAGYFLLDSDKPYFTKRSQRGSFWWACGFLMPSELFAAAAKKRNVLSLAGHFRVPIVAARARKNSAERG